MTPRVRDRRALWGGNAIPSLLSSGANPVRVEVSNPAALPGGLDCASVVRDPRPVDGGSGIDPCEHGEHGDGASSATAPSPAGDFHPLNRAPLVGVRQCSERASLVCWQAKVRPPDPHRVPRRGGRCLRQQVDREIGFGPRGASVPKTSSAHAAPVWELDNSTSRGPTTNRHVAIVVTPWRPRSRAHFGPCRVPHNAHRSSGPVRPLPAGYAAFTRKSDTVVHRRERSLRRRIRWPPVGSSQGR